MITAQWQPALAIDSCVFVLHHVTYSQLLYLALLLIIYPMQVKTCSYSILKQQLQIEVLQPVIVLSTVFMRTSIQLTSAAAAQHSNSVMAHQRT